MLHCAHRPSYELVIQHSNIRSRPRVQDKDATSISNWFHNHQHAILTDETEYINHISDLFSMVPKTKAPLRRLLERSSRFRMARMWRRIFPDNDDENVHYASDQHIDRFVTVVITAIGLTMLIAPLWILAGVQKMSARLGIITAFIVGFVVLFSLTAVVRPFESLAGAAA